MITNVRAQKASSDTLAAAPRAAALDTVKVTGREDNLVGIATSANQGTIGAKDLSMRPLLRPGEIVENIPGVIVTQHSGSGKANQYFLRGFNLDHGTDLALGVDGVPVNMPSHAHGQGYADLNFIIPELIERVDFEKGPYYANVGDFGSAGSFDVHLYDSLPVGFLHAEGGESGAERVVAANNVGIGAGNLVLGGELEHNNGPWDLGDNERKADGVARYARGDARNGVTLTAMGYHNSWRSTDQIPDRALADHEIDRWGTIDSSDAGNTARYALSADWHTVRGSSTSHVLAYVEHYDLDLFSNFTYFLNDPLHGDQIEQHDDRAVAGASAAFTRFASLLGKPSSYTTGVQLRFDDIDNGLYHTELRQRLGVVTRDDIRESSLSPYVENRTDWSDWLRTVVGLRADAFWFDVHSAIGGSSGSARESLLSPKVSITVGPWKKTELYLNGGYGFHSNDARGIVAHADPATPLPRSLGAEIGARTASVHGLESSISFWMLDLASELVWEGDAGESTPSGPTRRYGIEVANFYAPARWLTIDADYAWSHARFRDAEPLGRFVPEALVSTFDGGVAVHDLGGARKPWSSAIRIRYFGPRPLTQDGAVRSKATSLIYADAGYAISARWRLGVSVFNLLDTRASDIDYYYRSRLPGEPAAGEADVHSHPAEPREIKLSLTTRF